MTGGGIAKARSEKEYLMTNFHKLFQLAALTAAAAIVIAATQDIALVQGATTPVENLIEGTMRVS
jgi:hypothetical protein|tara:strand:- start:3688 stop:3882 length:195 start_codon:yes stop_codon:yes gene_type:complete